MKRHSCLGVYWYVVLWIGKLLQEGWMDAAYPGEPRNRCHLILPRFISLLSHMSHTQIFITHFNFSSTIPLSLLLDSTFIRQRSTRDPNREVDRAHQPLSSRHIPRLSSINPVHSVL